MWTAWWVVLLLGAQHGSGREPVLRPREPTSPRLSTAHRASSWRPVPANPPAMPKEKQTYSSIFPSHFTQWDMKKVTMMKWLYDLMDVLPQIDARIRIMAKRGITTYRNTIVTSSDRHTQDIERGIAREWTMEDPAPRLYVPKVPPTDAVELATYTAIMATTAPDVEAIKHRIAANKELLDTERQNVAEYVIMACADESAMRAKAAKVGWMGGSDPVRG